MLQYMLFVKLLYVLVKTNDLIQTREWANFGG